MTETFFPAVDGTTTTVKAVVDRLVDTGHDGPADRSGARPDDVPRLPGRPDPAARQARRRRCATPSPRSGPTSCTSPRRGTVGRKALKHADRLGVPTVVVEQSPLLDVAADYWRTRVADRAATVLVTSRWMLDRVAELGGEPRCGRPASTPPRSRPALRDTWLHDRWSRARSLAEPLVVVGYVGSLRNRHDVRRLVELAQVPGIRPVVVGDGPQRGWLEARLPGAKFTGSARAPATWPRCCPPSTCWCTPAPARPAATRCARPRRRGVPVVAPRSGGAPDVVRHLETGLLYDDAHRARAARRRRRARGRPQPGPARRARPRAGDPIVDRRRRRAGRATTTGRSSRREATGRLTGCKSHPLRSPARERGG